MVRESGFLYNAHTSVLACSAVDHYYIGCSSWYQREYRDKCNLCRGMGMLPSPLHHHHYCPCTTYNGTFGDALLPMIVILTIDNIVDLSSTLTAGVVVYMVYTSKEDTVSFRALDHNLFYSTVLLVGHDH